MKFRKLLGGGLLAAVLALGGVAGLATRSESKSVSAASSTGCFGYETFYIIDKLGGFNAGESMRVYIKSNNGNHDLFSEGLTITTTIEDGGNTYNAYRYIVPEYSFNDGGFWDEFRILRLNPEYASDTSLNWDHVWNGTAEGLVFSSYLSKNLLWLDSYSNWTMNLGESFDQNFAGPVSGSTMYFELNGWGSDRSYDIGPMAVYFYNYLDGEGNAWSPLFNFENTIAGSDGDFEHGLWEFKVPYLSDSTVTWRNYIVVEMNKGTTVASWDNRLYQSGDLTFTTLHNVIKGDATPDYSVGAAKRAEYFGTYFNKQTDGEKGGVCDSQGGTSASALSTAWTNVKKAFPLGRQPQTIITNATAAKEGSTELEKAVARYDYIIGKYNTKTTTVYEDFAHRVDAGKVVLSESRIQISLFDANNTTPIMLVVIISVVSLTAVGGYIFLKRRKED